MTGKELIEEGKRLARPCVHLGPKGNGEVAGVWGGPGTVPSSIPDAQHWITIDCRFLPDGFSDLTGRLSVYLHGSRGGVEVGPPQLLSHGLLKGKALYTEPGESPPPIDIVFKQGTQAVADWLTSVGWQRDWGYNRNFKDGVVADEYNQYWMGLNPGYALPGEPLSGVYATLGGWHSLWPDSEPGDSEGRRLVLTTYYRSEPWVEVWVDNHQQFHVFQRIT